MNSRRFIRSPRRRARAAWRHGQAQRLRGLEIDDQFELGRLHDRQIGRLGAIENPADIDADLAKRVGKSGAVADQAAGNDIFALRIDRRNACRAASATNRRAAAVEERVAADEHLAGRHPAGRASAKAASILSSVPAVSCDGSCTAEMVRAPSWTSAAWRFGARDIWIHERGDRRGVGINSCNSPIFFVPSAEAWIRLTPVTFPPGRLRLAIRPCLDRIGGADEYDRSGRCRRLGGTVRDRCRPWRVSRRPDGRPVLGRQRRQAVIMPLGPAVLDRENLSLDITCFAQALTEGLDKIARDTLRARRREEIRPPASPIAARAPRAAHLPPRRRAML